MDSIFMILGYVLIAIVVVSILRLLFLLIRSFVRYKVKKAEERRELANSNYNN